MKGDGSERADAAESDLARPLVSLTDRSEEDDDAEPSLTGWIVSETKLSFERPTELRCIEDCLGGRGIMSSSIPLSNSGSSPGVGLTSRLSNPSFRPDNAAMADGVMDLARLALGPVETGVDVRELLGLEVTVFGAVALFTLDCRGRRAAAGAVEGRVRTRIAAEEAAAEYSIIWDRDGVGGAVDTLLRAVLEVVVSEIDIPFEG